MAPLTPDIAKKTLSPISSPLERVGMEDIEVPLRLELHPSKESILQMGRADAYVNLAQPEAKGIHMSRLFIRLQEELGASIFTRSCAKTILEKFLDSHSELSDKAFLNISYEHPMWQKSLTSNQKSLRAYPVKYSFSLDKKENFYTTLTLETLYSSTCPCSAALSRQALQEKLSQDFKDSKSLDFKTFHEWIGQEKNMAATPHSQRSRATVTLELKNEVDYKVEDFICLIENTLKTTVQSIVKREDEKEFAKLNASNLMFAEDAARRIKKALNTQTNLHSFLVKVCHYESLHAHNAVAYAQN
jgi:GTP cyclohydrolase I